MGRWAGGGRPCGASIVQDRPLSADGPHITFAEATHRVQVIRRATGNGGWLSSAPAHDRARAADDPNVVCRAAPDPEEIRTQLAAKALPVVPVPAVDHA